MEWLAARGGTRTALIVTHKGALDGRGATVGTLAEDLLGVGERHLVRLSRNTWGAIPGQVAKTIRVQRAKRLLDTTAQSMSAVALASGFGSLRRFNASIP